MTVLSTSPVRSPPPRPQFDRPRAVPVGGTFGGSEGIAATIRAILELFRQQHPPACTRCRRRRWPSKACRHAIRLLGYGDSAIGRLEVQRDGGVR